MSENVGTRNSLKEVKTELEMHKNLLKERVSYLDMLSSELKEKEIHIDKLNEEIKERKSQLDVFYTELKEKGPRIEKLYDEMKRKDSQIDNLNIELREHNFRLDKLNTELKERYSQLDALRVELKERDLKLDRLYTKLKEKDSQLDALNVELKGRNSQLDTLLTELRGRDSQLDTLLTELRGRDSQLDALLAELRTRDSKLDALIAELKGRDSQLDVLLGTLKGKDSAIDNLSNEVMEKEAQLIKLQFTLRDRDTEMVAIRNTRGWRILERYRKIRDHVLLRKKVIESQGNLPKKMAASVKDISFRSPIPKSDEKIASAQIASKVPNINKATQISRFLNDTIDNPIQSRVSIIIPTKDAGDEFDYALRRVSQQEGVKDIEIIIIDSGSTDNTIEISRRYTEKIFHISPEDFHHSHTRNFGAERATGKYLVFTVQDACPVGEQWLYKLIRPIQQGQSSAVSAQQIPHSDADLFASWSYWSHNINFLGNDHDHFSNRSSNENFNDIDIQTKRVMASLDSVCLGIKKEVFDSYLFKADYAEDLELGLRLLSDNHTLMFQSSNAVIHSHNRPAIYFFRRSYADTVNLWNILEIARQNMPVGHVLCAISFLYLKLKRCMSALNILENGSMPSLILLSLIDLMDDNKYRIDRSQQFLRGDPSMDDFFKKFEPKNREDTAQKMNSKFKNNIMSFSEFMSRYIEVEDIREDFVNSIYKLFCVTAGNYLGENTRGKIEQLGGRI
jgi:glycosyltransferase involved in cell wall biosynthesis/uncharacterized protein (DUF3084 family)